MPYTSTSLLDFYERASFDFVTGAGAYLYTEEGERYLDMAAGYASNCFGYSHPALVASLRMQVDKFWHLCNRYKIPNTVEFCDLLVKYTGLDKVYPCNTGAEAVESAIKFARRFFYGQNVERYRFITIEGAFHGRTLAAASASTKEKMEGFGPRTEGFDRVPFNDIEALRQAVTPQTAGVLLEPIQGEGGMRAHTDKYMKEVRNICDQRGILLLFDEVQCGMGRTGYMFAADYYGVKPDIFILAKGLGGGFPVAAVVLREALTAHFKKGSHGSTFGGNPLAIAAGLKVLQLFQDKDVLANVKRVGIYLRKRLEEVKADYPTKIDEVRGVGLMAGIKFKASIGADVVVEKMRDEHILTIPAADNVLRITPPLIIKEQQVDEMITALRAVLAAL